jgi:hypothetical protein
MKALHSLLYLFYIKTSVIKTNLSYSECKYIILILTFVLIININIILVIVPFKANTLPFSVRFQHRPQVFAHIYVI